MTGQKDNTAPVNVIIVILLFLLAHTGLSFAGLVPSEVSEFNQSVISTVASIGTLSYQQESRAILPRSNVAQAQQETVIGTLPTQISIPEIGINSEIITPEKAAIEVLDKALKEGVVHYPGSGGIGGDRRMFLFGHSSRLPVVNNQAYRSFNGLDKLEEGDVIAITAEGERVTYSVTSVEVVDQDEALVSFVSGAGELTLSTCTTFGTRENRVVVQAEVDKSATR